MKYFRQKALYIFTPLSSHTFVIPAKRSLISLIVYDRNVHIMFKCEETHHSLCAIAVSVMAGYCSNCAFICIGNGRVCRVICTCAQATLFFHIEIAIFLHSFNLQIYAKHIYFLFRRILYEKSRIINCQINDKNNVRALVFIARRLTHQYVDALLTLMVRLHIKNNIQVYV